MGFRLISTICRIFASGLDGAVYMWDRRSSKTHCLELMSSPESQFNTVKLSVDNQVCWFIIPIKL